MTKEIGGPRPGVSRPGAPPSVVDLEDFEGLIALFCEQRAAERVGKHLSGDMYRLVRNRLVAMILGQDPDWAPANEREVSVWGHGYNAGHRQGYADGAGQ